MRLGFLSDPRVAGMMRAEWWIKHRGALIKAACGFILIAILLRSVDASALLQRISTVKPSYFVLATGMLCLQLLIFAARLHLMAHCSGGRMPLSQAAIANYELAFLTQVVPTQLAGDAIRVVRAHKSGMTWTHGFCAVFLDRSIGLLTMVLVSPLILLFVPFSALKGPVLAMAALLIVGGVAGVVLLYMMGPRLQHLAHNRVARVAITASDTLRTLLNDPFHAVFALVVSLVGHACSAAAASLIAAGLGIQFPFWPAVPAMALIQIAIMVPLSIGGWGVREGAAIFVLGLIGVSAADSLAVSILYGLATLIVGLIGGLVWLNAGYRSAEVEEELRQAQMTAAR